MKRRWKKPEKCWINLRRVFKCANERHRNDFIKYITPWWSKNNLLTRCVSCSVRSPVSRPSPKLASSRLRQRLLGAAASQTSRRKPRYRQSDLFSNSSWLYYFTHHVLQCSSSAHCQKLLACRGALKRNSPFRPNYKTQKNRDTVTVVNFRHCASAFLLSWCGTFWF